MNNNTLSLKNIKPIDKNAIKNIIGSAALKANVIARIDNKSAYLSSRGKTSPEYKSIYYFFVFFEVFFVQQLVSHIFLRHLRKEVKMIYMIGRNILKQSVIVIITPILKYQSEVISL